MKPERTKEDLAEAYADNLIKTMGWGIDSDETKRWIIGDFIAGWNAAQSSPVESKWVSVKERLPKFGEPVLCFCQIYGRYIGWYQQIDDTDWGNWNDGRELGVLPPTHWHPIPCLPELPPIEETKEKYNG